MCLILNCVALILVRGYSWVRQDRRVTSNIHFFSTMIKSVSRLSVRSLLIRRYYGLNPAKASKAMEEYLRSENKRAASKNPLSVKTVASLVSDFKTPELIELQKEIQKLILAQPLSLGPLPDTLKHLEGQFQVWDNGSLRTTFPNTSHKYTWRWKDGEELVIKYSYKVTSNYSGKKSEVETIHVGPLFVVIKTPGNPDVNHVNDLYRLLKNRGIDTEELVGELGVWIVQEVLKKHQSKLLRDVFAQSEWFYRDYGRYDSDNSYSDSDSDSD